MMLTSDDQNLSSSRYRELGLHTHLVKPVNPPELLESILAVIGANSSIRSSASLPAADPVSTPLRILVAEDNVVNQKLVCRLLQKMGHTVHLSENGQLAVDAFSHGHFDLVLMDVQMPVMDGFEATREIRRIESSRPWRTPIVALTAHAMKRDEERCLEAGMDAVLTKPIDFKKLQKTLSGYARLQPPALTPLPSSDQPPARNNGTIRALEHFGEDAGFFRELATTFLDYYPKDVAHLKVSIEQGDLETVRRIAHTLKGAASNFEATDVVEAAQDLELAARQYDLSSVNPGFQKLESRLANFQKHLQELVSE